MDLSLVTRVAVGSGRPLSCSVGTAALSCVSWPPYRMGRSIRPGREGLHSVADWPRGLLWPGCHRAKPHFLGGGVGEGLSLCRPAAWGLGRVTCGGTVPFSSMHGGARGYGGGKVA